MLFADDVIRVLPGPKWNAAADIVRLLAPTILVFGIINPVGWLMTPLGAGSAELKARSHLRATHYSRLRCRGTLRT